MTKILSPIQPSNDTFQVWLQRTNDLVNELSTSIVTASVLGDSTTGNATLIGNFTANTIIGREYVRAVALSNLSGNTVPIDVVSPVKITSPEQNSFTIRNTSGPRIRVQNDNIAWLAGLNGSAGTGTGAQFVIGVEGSPFQVRVGVDGFLYANTVLLDGESSNVASAVRSSRTISTNSGIIGGGDLTANRALSLTGNALSLHNLSANGIVTKTASGTVTARTMTQSTGITITNGNGVAGNPTFAIDTSVVATVSTAQTITGNKTFSGLTTFNGNVQLNGNTVVSHGTISANNITITGAISANGSIGTAGQTLRSDGTKTYWSTEVTRTQAQWNAGTDTTEAVISPAKLRGALDAHRDESQLGWMQAYYYPSRAFNTTYQNTTGQPIFVSIACYNSYSDTRLQWSVNGSAWATVANEFAGGTGSTICAIIPPNHYYRLSGSTTIAHWMELY